MLAVGSGPCVGAVGAALAGGHGRLQGKWGLTQDAIESLRVVLANGTAINVSAKQNTDLWWAMRGAGQNFGVVVSAILKTFPQTKNGMHYNGDMIMNGTQVEKVFELFNTMIPDWPAELAVDVLFAAIPGTLTVSSPLQLEVPTSADNCVSPSFPSVSSMLARRKMPSVTPQSSLLSVV